MASDSIHCEILRRAAEIAGGEAELAQHLDVRPEDMHEWVQAKATAPAGIYIIAVDTLSRVRKEAPQGSSPVGLYLRARVDARRRKLTCACGG
jgi:hypothetical protein